MCETNQAVVSRFFLEVIGQGRVERIDELLGACYVEHRNGIECDANAGIRASLVAVRDAFPNRMVIVEDLTSAGDLVWCRWSLSAQHLRPFIGVPATGATIETSGVDVFRIENGRIAERWTHEGSLGLRRQLELASAVPA